MEWYYGDYGGLTPEQIYEMSPGWLIFRDGCPGGETPAQVGARVDRVIGRAGAAEGDAALFAHGYVLRALAAGWLGLPAGAGQHFLLDTGTLSVLGSTATYRREDLEQAPRRPACGPVPVAALESRRGGAGFRASR